MDSQRKGQAMRYRWAIGAVLAGAMAGCGVPREAATIAAQQAVSTTVPAADADVRAQLVAQDAAWAQLAALLQKRTLGGITGVDAEFVQLVNQTAALAKRQHALIDQQQDDPAFDRQSLSRFETLWQSARTYLGE